MPAGGFFKKVFFLLKGKNINLSHLVKRGRKVLSQSIKGRSVLGYVCSPPPPFFTLCVYALFITKALIG
jgi:hypothetical protein